MNLLSALKTHARYNRWMNEKLYAACAPMPDALRKEDRGAFFRSVHGTLNHLLLADHLWMGHYTGEPFPAASLDQELHSEFDAMRRDREALDRELMEWVNGLGESRLNGTVTFRAASIDQEFTFSLGACLLHQFNHQTHHRGQLTTLMEQLGYDSGVTDLLRLPDQETLGY
jgi:uncharacterized damage-inducible protein DinB